MSTTIEEMFGEDALKQSPLEKAKREEVARAYSVVAEMLTAQPDLRDAVRTIAAFWISGPTDALLNDFSVLRDPVEAAKTYGKRVGLDVLADELTNTTAIGRTVAWLTDHEPNEQE